MNNFFLTVGFIFITTLTSRSQSALERIGGQIVTESNVPIAYVNVALSSDASVGTYSNSEGQFQIQIIVSSPDSLKFSCIGYETVAVPLQSLDKKSFNNLRIVLKEKLYVLDAVEISTDTALSIVRKSVENLKNNLGNDRAILQGFYREIIRSDKTYDRLVEAAVDVFDKGYQQGDLQFKVREIRKSDDFRDMDWQMSIFNFIRPLNNLNGPYESLFYNDYIRNNKADYAFISNAPLNESFFQDVTFTLDSITQDQSGPVLRIGITSKDALSRGPKGYLFIRKKDYAILEMQYQYDTDEDDPLKVPHQPFLHKTLIKYKQYQGKMYVSLLHRTSLHLEINVTKLKKTSSNEGLFYHELLYVTNEVITEKSKAKAFKKKERQKADVDLYTTQWTYNPEFWKNYNLVNERPLQPSIKKDIERNNTIDEQFRNNSN